MGKVLLVDDNPLRASVRRTALEREPSSVLKVSDAAEAFCTVETPEAAESLGLVVTGHQMSGISGPEFVAEMRRRMPRLPVLVVHSSEGFEPEYQGIEGVSFAANPTMEELRRIADKLLAGVGEWQTA